MYLVNFCFQFQWFLKLTPKFFSHWVWFQTSKFQTWQWQKLKKSISQLPSTHAVPKSIQVFKSKQRIGVSLFHVCGCEQTSGTVFTKISSLLKNGPNYLECCVTLDWRGLHGQTLKHIGPICNLRRELSDTSQLTDLFAWDFW